MEEQQFLLNVLLADSRRLKLSRYIQKHLSIAVSALLFICITFSFCIAESNVVVKNKIKQVNIYYYNWDVNTRSALTANNIRDNYMTKIIIRDTNEINEFIKFLVINNFKSNDYFTCNDIRLVVDISYTDGSMASFKANKFVICTDDGKLKRNIDDTFKNKFRYRK